MIKVTILGSSSFLSNEDRFGSSYLIEIDDKKMLVDTGSGCQVRLAQLKIGIKDLNYIFITHFHPDHTTDLLSIFLRFAMVVKNNPELNRKLTIYGPRGIRNFIYNSLRISELQVFEDKPGALVKEMSNFKDDDFTVKAFKTEHMGATSQGYRFKVDGKSVVFTGDTIYYPRIIDDCKNADLLFIDSSKNSTEATTVHLNTTQIAEICNKANIKKVILCHILGYNADKDLKGEVKKDFDGEVVMSKDLMQFTL